MRSSPCSNPHWKDGFCKVHHPDSVKERYEKSRARYSEKLKDDPFHKMIALKNRITILERALKPFAEYADSLRFSDHDDSTHLIWHYLVVRPQGTVCNENDVTVETRRIKFRDYREARKALDSKQE